MTKEIVIPSNPKDQKKIRDSINELVNSLYRMQSEKDLQKDIIQVCSDEFNLDKKYIRQMAQDAYKDSFDKKVHEFGSYSDLYETVMILNKEKEDDSENLDEDEL